MRPERISVTRKRTIGLGNFESDALSFTLTCGLTDNGGVEIEASGELSVDDIKDVKKGFKQINNELEDVLDREEYKIRKMVVDNDWFDSENVPEKLKHVKKRIKARKEKG